MFTNSCSPTVSPSWSSSVAGDTCQRRKSRRSAVKLLTIGPSALVGRETTPQDGAKRYDDVSSRDIEAWQLGDGRDLMECQLHLSTMKEGQH
jgi:hypothetical protein